ncbi:MAG: TatD family hydrolase [Candidatus Woesearchaeota archaeon]
MLLIDVHAHLDLEGYEIYGGIDNLLKECVANNVKAIITNGTNIESNKKILELSKKHDIVKIALGIYPTHCLELIESNNSTLFEKELESIEKNIINKKCIAIGEVGLEYSEIKDLNDAKKNIQKDCLKKFIALAKKYDIPIILHSRGAESDLIELLEKEDMKDHKVIMHCFSGRKHLVQKVRDNGWFFSIPCNLARNLHFQQIVNGTPIAKLLTETDAPYQSPIPGTVNRSDNVRLTITKIAELKKMTEEEVSNIIYANYMKLFL